MLEFYFVAADDLRRKWDGPLVSHLDTLAENLKSQGFCRDSGRRILRIAGRFNVFVRLSGLTCVGQIGKKWIGAFLASLGRNGSFRYALSDLHHLLDHLCGQGILPEDCPPCVEGPFAAILGRYDQHLCDIRGNTPLTREGYVLGARRLLQWILDRHGERPLSALNGSDILDFITEFANRYSGGSWPNQLCSTTRIFLRYLQWEGIVTAGLNRMVPRVPGWRLSTLPRHLTWEQSRTLIDSVDTRNPKGLRDKAVLLLLATLGLRNEEVRSLRFEDVAWRAAEIRLSESKARRERVLPLPREVGEALSAYVLHGRPPLDVPQIFLRHRSPQGPLTTSHGVSNIVLKHLERAGIEAPAHGAYLLRHTLATRMVNRGVPIKEIADVLGHASIDTTAIYTKVDVSSLVTVALPFPGGVQ